MKEVIRKNTKFRNDKGSETQKYYPKKKRPFEQA